MARSSGARIRIESSIFFLFVSKHRNRTKGSWQSPTTRSITTFECFFLLFSQFFSIQPLFTVSIQLCLHQSLRRTSLSRALGEKKFDTSIFLLLSHPIDTSRGQTQTSMAIIEFYTSSSPTRVIFRLKMLHRIHKCNTMTVHILDSNKFDTFFCTKKKATSEFCQAAPKRHIEMQI